VPAGKLLRNQFASIAVVLGDVRVAPVPERGRMKNPGVAAVLSFIIPGMGQLYNGTFWRAIFWFIITPGLWIGTGGLLGWVCHIIAAYTAYGYARERSYRVA
jgi:TM2 domain-containing membrane protein YozV